MGIESKRAYLQLVYGEPPVNWRITRIVANTLAQAEIVANKLQIPHRKWRLVRDRRDLYGVSQDQIAIADPPLGDVTHREAEINDELWRIRHRDKGEFLWVKT